jgi:hypothetical protein
MLPAWPVVSSLLQVVVEGVASRFASPNALDQDLENVKLQKVQVPKRMTDCPTKLIYHFNDCPTIHCNDCPTMPIQVPAQLS